MKHAKLAFDQIKANSVTLARRLRSAGIFRVDENGCGTLNDELETLEVTFIGFEAEDRLLLEDVAVLALLIRWVAISDRQVEIIYPKKFKGQPSRIFYYLERLQFHKLLAEGVSGERWHERVTFKNYDPTLSIHIDTSTVSAHYLPLRWFTKHDFTTNTSLSIWKREPTVGEEFERHFRGLLTQQSFLDRTMAETLFRVLFLELGWNTVLHSEIAPGLGIGVFGLQVVGPSQEPMDSPRVRFVVADWGRGIPSTLGPAYDQDARPSFKLRHRRGLSRVTDVVRYSLFPDTTSRSEFPSVAFQQSYRGLARVAAALHQSGQIQLRSGGGAVRLLGQLKGETVAEPDETFVACALPGTQVIGELARVPARIGRTLDQQGGPELPEAQIVQVCDSMGRCGQIATAELAEKFISDTTFTKEVVLFDLGYAASGSRMMEYLCRAVVKLTGLKWLIFWNVADDWNLLGALDSFLQIHDEFSGQIMPPLCVRGYGDARLIGPVGDNAKWRHATGRTRAYTVVAKLIVASKSAQSVVGPPVGFTVPLMLAEYQRLHVKVNSHYLRMGFEQVSLAATGETTNGTAGFFVGQIHLIKGGPPEPRYFALRRNLEDGGERLRKRWAQGLASALHLLLTNTGLSSNEDVVIIGFTGTIREILEDACTLLPIRWRAYVLLTFDVPTKEELAVVVAEHNAVILVTDIISSGTLAESVADIILRLGARIIGVTSLILRPGNDRVVEDQIRLGREQYLYLPLGNLPPWNSGQSTLTQTKFWVDPVVLVPNARPAWGWSPTTIRRIDQTLDIIRDADAAACGHIVDGARHASTYVFTNLLFRQQEQAIRRMIEETVNVRLAARNWVDFNPRVLLFPSGIARLESVAAAPGLGKTTPPTAGNYQTAVAACVLLVQQIWQMAQSYEVARAFDPNGAARCAQTIHITQTDSERSDMVIVDDGIWKGSTTSALIRLAMSLSARRIFVVPLLSRLTPQDAEALEALHSLQSAAVDGVSPAATEICYAFPLHLPVPFYSFHECPYEITQTRLRDRRGSNAALRRIADNLIQELDGRTPAAPRAHSREFKDAWLRTRAYVELASQSEEALQKLQKLIEGMPPNEGLTAIFTLFVDEWRLLGRARVRHDIFQSLRKRAMAAAVDMQVATSLRTIAITILRALFRDDFVEILPDLVPVVVGNQTAFERLIFHIATLPNEWRKRAACVRALEEIVEKCASTAATRLVTPEMIETEHALLSFVRSLALELRFSPLKVQSPKQAVIELWHQLEGGFWESHNLVAYFNMCSQLKAEKLSDNLVRDLVIEWEMDHSKQLREKLLPMLIATAEVLIKTASIKTVFLPTEYSFLSRECQETMESIGAFENALRSLKDLSGRGAVRSEIAEMSPYYRNQLIATGTLIYTQILSQDSLVRRLLGEINSVRAVHVIDQFVQSLETALVSFAVKVELIGVAQLTPSLRLFVPNAIVRECIANVSHNLLVHAFPVEKTSFTPKVRLTVRQEVVVGGEPVLIIVIANNGRSLEAQAELGEGGRHVAANILVFGGRITPAQSGESNDWSVLHTIHFPLWNNQ
ncbi:MAG TPA: hypothetical protein VGM64_20635 [Lacunisphaera sp.]|jgi:adenine/guanine phosphoribosyltransferase-like PRPP-binding protein